MGRHWHFFSIIFWIANGAAYYILLFTSNEWARLIPTSWSIFQQAIHTAMLYASFHFAVPGNPYDQMNKARWFIKHSNEKHYDTHQQSKLMQHGTG
jgi:methionine sulfoxide reductase catalytic subunit